MKPSTPKTELPPSTQLRKAVFRGSLISSGLALLWLTSGCVPENSDKLNSAAYFGWGGYADTPLQFSQFFNGDHTVMGWAMMQYPAAYAGPFVAENGGGTYFIGQGDFKDEAPNGAKFRIAVGSQTAVATVPESFVKEKWVHFAMVRSGNTFTFYVDAKTSVQITINPGDMLLPAGNATVRLGRRSDGKTVNAKRSQFYGFLDDVAVFNFALSKEVIGNIYEQKRLNLSGLVGPIAAWTFDEALPNGDPLPLPYTQYPVSFGTLTPGLKPAGETLVSQARNHALDATFLPLPFQQKEAILPFAVGIPWVVFLGYGKNTHIGGAAFCWDLRREDVPNAQTCGQPLYASVAGTAEGLVDSGPGLAACDGDGVKDDPPLDANNFFTVKHAPDEVIVYMHVKTGSVGPNVNFQTPPFPVAASAPIAQVGTLCPNNCHLHLGVRTETNINDAVSMKSDAVSIPLAFSYYQASDDGGKTWYNVERGVPQHGQWIRQGLLIGAIVKQLLEFVASGNMDVQSDPASMAPEQLVIQRFSLASSNQLLQTAFSNTLPFLPKIRGQVTLSSLSLYSSGAITCAVDRAGGFVIDADTLRAQAELTIDLGAFGRFNRTMDEPAGRMVSQLAGQISLGSTSAQVQLKGTLPLGTVEGSFTGARSSEGRSALLLDANKLAITSPFLNGGRADINSDGKVDSSDLGEFIAGFTGPRSDAHTADCFRRQARAEARVEIDPAVDRPHSGQSAWDVQVLNDGVTRRSNWGNDRGNYDTFNGAAAAESHEWLALLLGRNRSLTDFLGPIDGSTEDVRVEFADAVSFTAFRYWRGAQYHDGGWWAGPVAVEVMTRGDPRIDREVLNDGNWTEVARSDGTLGQMTVGPFVTTPEPNDDPDWDAQTKVHRELPDPPPGSYQFSDSGDADDERPDSSHFANDGDREFYVARPDYLHFTFAETRGAGIRIRGLSAHGPGGTGTYVSGAELQAWFNPTNAPEGFCDFIAVPAHADAFDKDGDGDIDLEDYNQFLGAFNGPPRIEGVQLTNTQLQITFSALANRRYQIEATDTLPGAGWAPVADFPPGVVPRTLHFQVPVAQDRRFFRVALLP